MLPPLPNFFLIDEARMSKTAVQHLNRLRELYAKSEPSKFERKLLAALFLYARNVSSRDPTDRLIYIFSALEAILSKKGEQVAQSLGDQMAYLAAKDPEERVRLMKLVKRMYGLRSDYVHRGELLSSEEDFAQFLALAHFTILKLITLSERFSTVEEMHEWLDKAKFSGALD